MSHEACEATLESSGINKTEQRSFSAGLHRAFSLLIHKASLTVDPRAKAPWQATQGRETTDSNGVLVWPLDTLLRNQAPPFTHVYIWADTT